MSSSRRSSMIHLGLVIATAVVLALVSPLLDDPSMMVSSLTHITVDDILIAIILAVSLNLILGMAGQFSLGHAGFMAVGAYTTAVLVGKQEFLLPQLGLWHQVLGFSIAVSFTIIGVTAIAASVVTASVAGLLVGLPTLRLRGDYLAIATLGFGEIIFTLISNSDYLERTYGLRIDSMRQHWFGPFFAKEYHGTPPALAVAMRAFNAREYYLGSFWFLGAAVLAVWVIRNIKYSTSGRALLAVREDTIASEAVGIPTTRFKVAAFVIGAAFAGIAGALFAHYGDINPKNFRFMSSVTIVLFVILGGQGSITGSVVAAILLTLLPVLFQRNTVLDANLTEKYRMVVYSLLIILSTLFMRKGLFGRHEITDLFRRRKGSVAGPCVSGEGMGELDGAESAVLAGKGEVLLLADKVTMQFGGLKAVDAFSLELRQGELVGLIGPNGAGKTTVFNVLTGVYRPTSGVIEVGGRSIVGKRSHAIARAGVARTFQNIRLFGNLTVLDNVQIAQHARHKHGMPAAILRTPAFFREEEQSRREAMAYLDLFGLASLAGEQASNLCYGDQRRLEIARALATRPKVLLLDEPAAGMNPTEKQDLMGMIRSIRQRFGLTILIIEHDMKLIMGICERIVVLDYGKMIATGTPEEIRRNPAVIEAYLGAGAKQG